MAYLVRQLQQKCMGDVMKKIIIMLVVMSVFAGSFGVFQGQVAYESGETNIFQTRVAYAAEEEVKVNSFTLPVCWLGLTSGGISVIGCFAQIVYHVIYTPTAWLLRAAGEIFDTMLSISLDKDFINAGFANDGWKMTRDVVNIAFIFILLYAAISTILQANTAKTRSIIIRLVIVALLVNFSLFFTKVVIDSSNIMALAFYNGITVSAPATQYAKTGTPQKNISAEIINSFNPQKLIGKESFSAFSRGEADNDLVGPGGFIIVILAASVINVVVAYSLLVVGFYFLARLITLWFLMIAAPVAFIAWIHPRTASYTDKWWSALLKASFLAPIFLFMLFLIIKFLIGENFLTDSFTSPENSGTASISTFIISILIKAGIIILTIQYAVKVTKNLSSDMAKGIVNRAAGIGKFAALGVMGGAGLAARAVALRAAPAVVAAGAKKGVVGAGLRFTGMARGAGAVEARAKGSMAASMKKSKEQVSSSSTTALKTRMASPLTGPTTKAAIMETLAERGDIKPEGVFTPEIIKATTQKMEMDQQKTTSIKNLSYQYASTEKERVAAVSKISSKAVEDGLPKEYYTEDASRQEMYKNWGKGQIEKVIDSPKIQRNKNVEINPEDESTYVDPAEEFFNGLKEREEVNSKGKKIKVEIKTIEEVIKYATDINNPRLAAWAKSPMGKNTLEAYGFDGGESTTSSKEDIRATAEAAFKKPQA